MEGMKERRKKRIKEERKQKTDRKRNETVK